MVVQVWRRQSCSRSCSSFRKLFSVLISLFTCPLRTTTGAVWFSMLRSSSSLSWRGGRFPCSCSADHGNSPVAHGQEDQCPRCGREGHQQPCRGAEAVSYGPDCLDDHRISLVARGQGVDVTVCAVVQVPQVQVMEETVEIHPVVLVVRVPQVLAVMMTVVIPQLHLVVKFALCPDVRKVQGTHCKGTVWAAHRRCGGLTGDFFRAVCTGTRPGESCPQGHGPQN